MSFVNPTQESHTLMKFVTVRFITIGLLTLFVAPLARAADDSFVGKWKFDPDKSQLSGLTYKVEDAGNGKYKFAFGDDVETVGFDGKEYPTKYGNTWSIKPAGANSWKWTIKRNGKLMSDATWTVSDDGATSIYANTETRPDGSASRDETKLKRTDGGTSGLVGTWESTEIKIGSPTTLEMAKWQTDGYSMKIPANKAMTNFKLDGKEYTPTGPRVAKGMAVSAKKTDDHKIELTYTMKGKTIETDSWEASADGKTLTDTITYPGINKQEVDVFDRQ
jgi:hypothetical protein